MTSPQRPAASALTELNRAWADAFNAGDLDRLIEFYEPDAVLVPGPGAEPVQGLDAIQASLEWLLELGGRLVFTPRHWIVSGDLALGSLAFVMDGGHDAEGNLLDLSGVTGEVVRRQEDGTWKYVIDHPFAAEA
jgi:uncharacterized protein (TIGR02246 family)